MSRARAVLALLVVVAAIVLAGWADPNRGDPCAGMTALSASAAQVAACTPPPPDRQDDLP